MKLGTRLLWLWGWFPSQPGDSCGPQPGPKGSVSWPPGPPHQGHRHAFWPPPHPGRGSQKSRERAFIGNWGCRGEGSIEYPVFGRQDVMVGKIIHADVRQTWIQIPPMPLISSMIGKMVNFSEPLQIEGPNLPPASWGQF